MAVGGCTTHDIGVLVQARAHARLCMGFADQSMYVISFKANNRNVVNQCRSRAIRVFVHMLHMRHMVMVTSIA